MSQFFRREAIGTTNLISRLSPGTLTYTFADTDILADLAGMDITLTTAVAAGANMFQFETRAKVNCRHIPL